MWGVAHGWRIERGWRAMPYVTNGGAKLYYEVEGQGFPIFLHTGGGGDGSMWRDGGYVDGLDGYQRILFDHRGHGRSDKPTTLGAYQIDHHISDVIAVLDALDLPRVVFWGYSGGASVGYALAASHPQRLAAFIASGAIDEPDASTTDALAERQALASGVRSEGMAYLVRAFEAEGEPMTPWFRKQMLDTDSEVFARQIIALGEWSGPWPLLQRITCPTLMLVGEREDPDGYTPRAAAQAPNARCVTFPELDHISAYERSDLALAQALPFLRALHLR